MSAADLLYSDTEDSLRDSVKRLLADRCPPEVVVSAYDAGPADFSGAWKSLATELGLAGLLVPESLGGAGASTREAAVVMEEIGRAVAPVPFLSSAVLATVALLKAGETQTLGALAAGAVTGALAVPLSTAPDGFASNVRVGDGGLVGRVTSVVGAHHAEVLVVPVTGAEGLELHTVARSAAEVTVTPVLSLDMTRPLADLEFSGAASTRVDSGNADAAVGDALLCGAVLLASEQLVWRSGASTRRLRTSRTASSSGVRSDRSRRSSTDSPISGSRSALQQRLRAMRPTRTRAETGIRRSRPPSRRPIAAGWRCTRQRNASSYTAVLG